MPGKKHDDDDDDSELYHGERGDAWRKFERDTLAQARGKFAKTDRCSYRSALLKMDEGTAL